jgi:hypothetical protein
MLPRRLLPLIPVALAAACSGDAELPTRAPLGPAEESRLVFQAVDAGTGAALTDDQMTVRYLVRAPITLDASAVEAAASLEPYAVTHPVAEDSLVVEVRLEAASYHRLDTVLAVARGDDAGPFTLRMTRRLARAGGGGGGAPTGGGLPAGAVAGSAPGGAAAPVSTGGAAMDRSALAAADRAYQSGNWVQAIQGYERLQLPDGASDADVRAYQGARVRQGVSHLNRSEYAAALDALEEAAGLRIPSGAASLRLAQAQCAVSRVDEGRRTIADVERMAPQLDAGERASALAMTQYVSALCGLGDLDRAATAMDRVRVGNRLVQELQAFVERAGTVSPKTDDLTAALADAQRQIEAIRARMRRGGGDGDS